MELPNKPLQLTALRAAAERRYVIAHGEVLGMHTLVINVPESEFERLNGLYPPPAKSSTVGKRAVELVQLYFRTIDPGCSFRVPGGGVDLEVTTNGISQSMEVKGTASSGIAWQQLKVSGGPCYERLLAGLPLYRVVAVYDRAPRIFVLKFPDDFELAVEPRWSLKPRR